MDGIIKIGISIIKHFESKLLNLTFETLLRFLINDIIKSDFFENESFDNLTFITYNFKIEAGLIKNLENESQFILIEDFKSIASLYNLFVS